MCVQNPEFTDKKVQAMKEYEYRVVAENEDGPSEPSDASKPIKAKPLKGTQPLQKIRFYSNVTLHLSSSNKIHNVVYLSVSHNSDLFPCAILQRPPSWIWRAYWAEKSE